MALSDRLSATDYYDADAAGFAKRYDSVSFGAVHPLLSRYLPNVGRALDVGAGSGRDARAMADRGLAVTAVEPSMGLRMIGEVNSADIRWLDDSLPRLAVVTAEGGLFNFILCSAVLMLVTPFDLMPSFAAFARLLDARGRLALNLRAPRPEEPAGLFFDHSDDAIVAAARSAGLACVDRGVADDAIGRVGYCWRSLIFERAS